MAEQATGAVDTAGAASAGSAHAAVQHLEHNPGRPVSWIGVLIAIIGSIVGGVAFFLQPVSWVMFWAGCAVFIGGLLVLAGARTLTKDWY